MEINISEERRPGKTCMTDKMINKADSQYRQGVFPPTSRKKVDLAGKEEPQSEEEQMMIPNIPISLHRAHSHAFMSFWNWILIILGKDVWFKCSDLGHQLSMTDVKLGQLPSSSESEIRHSSAIYVIMLTDLNASLHFPETLEISELLFACVLKDQMLK